MTIKIDKKIRGYEVVSDDAKKAAEKGKPEGAAKRADVIHMHEKVERPDTLIGCTYKIKSPLFEHALYVTINDIVLNQGTEHELRRPFEIFINSKNMDHFQWIVALTRIMSAVFRKGGDVTFLVEELKAVFDPRGGYFKAGGVYMPSIVAELGAIIERHLKMIGLLHDPELDEHQRQMIAEKRAAYEARHSKGGAKKKPEISPKAESGQSIADDLTGAGGETARKSPSPSPLMEEGRGEGEGSSDDADEESSFPAGATMCHKCNVSAVVIMDNCATCLNCGYSKCG